MSGVSRQTYIDFRILWICISIYIIYQLLFNLIATLANSRNDIIFNNNNFINMPLRNILSHFFS